MSKDLWHKGKKVEHRVIPAITHTLEAVGCSEHGFRIRTAKNAKRI
jgi:hypothetical protein